MQQQYPQKQGLDLILKRAFSYWSQTLGLQIMFSIVYFGIFMTVFYYFGMKYELFEGFQNAFLDYQEAGPSGIDDFKTAIATITDTVNFQYFMFAMMGVRIFLYPLNIGFFQIYKKIDLKENIEISDLFAGYNGINFFKFISFFMFWVLIYSFITQTIILPIIWVMLTIFAAPLMFFQNKRIFEILAIGWNALRTNFIEIFVSVLVAFIFCYAGFAVFFVGALFTFPFWNAMIYSLYTSLFEGKIQKAS